MKKDKKPFGQTKIGGFLKKALKGAVSEIPIVGSTVENVLSEEGGKGKLQKTKFAGQLIVGGVILLTVLEAFNVIGTGVTEQFVAIIQSIFE